MANSKDNRKRKHQEDNIKESKRAKLKDAFLQEGNKSNLLPRVRRGLKEKTSRLQVVVPNLKFESYEHDILGISVTLPDIPGGKVLTLANGISLPFGNIIAMAGDYYGIPDEPIIDPLNPKKIDDDARQRFKNAYDTLAVTPNEGKYKEQLDKLLKLLADDVKTAKKSGKKCFHTNREWDEATGGKWVWGIPYKPGSMIQLAMRNYDHFEPQAKTAYLVGHEYAIQKARKAGRSKRGNRQKLLVEAYCIDGFACHFLTDAFATGHMRTPRVALQMNVTPAWVGDILCNYMHNEDNKFGIRVTNGRGDKLIGRGDGMLLEKEQNEYFKLVVEAVQNSVNQVNEAYRNPDVEIDLRAVTDLIPFTDKKEKNNTPLFEVKNGEIHRRKNINNLQDTNTITNWRGFGTWGDLKISYKPKNSAI